jgi:SAP domain.
VLAATKRSAFFVDPKNKQMPGTTLSPANVSGQEGGRRRTGASVKTLKKVLKKAGLKTTGRKAALTRRAKKARLMRGGEAKPMDEVAPMAGGMDEAAQMGGKKRSRRSRKFLGVF